MSVQAHGITITYESASGQKTTAVSDIDLSIRTGEFVSIIGPSGCGKSTLLHCLGGMLSPTQGKVTVNDAEITEPDPRRAAFVFQDYSLFPWKTVVDNVSAGLRFAGRSRSARREEAMVQLELVGLADVATAYPAELSGGMQQRVAVARALSMEPDILLMDEPFGALDEQSRRRLGVEMAQLLTAAGKTIVMVTHSLDESIFWADRVLVMSKGPGRILDVLTIDGPRPRSLDFMTTETFDTQRIELFRLMEDQFDGPPAPGGRSRPMAPEGTR